MSATRNQKMVRANALKFPPLQTHDLHRARGFCRGTHASRRHDFSARRRKPHPGRVCSPESCGLNVHFSCVCPENGPCRFVRMGELTIRSNTKQYEAIRSNTKQYEAIRSNTKQYVIFMRYENVFDHGDSTSSLPRPASRRGGPERRDHTQEAACGKNRSGAGQS